MNAKENGSSFQEEALDSDLSLSKHFPFIDAGYSEEFIGAETKTQNRILEERKKQNEESDNAEQIRRDHPDLVKRAEALFKAEAFSFKRLKPIRMGDQAVTLPANTDANRWAAFDTLFGNGDNRPHLDTFSGRIVDHLGINIDDRYPIVDLLHALEAASLRDQSAEQVRKSLKEFALHKKWNGLIKGIQEKTPKWDGKERLETEIIERVVLH